jgi:peroxiredoxin
MVLVHSVDLPLGTPMPEFTLQDPDGKTFQGRDLPGSKGLLVVFTCNHCPYANAQWPRFIRLAEEFAPRGINTVAVNANLHPDYPDDAPPKMKDKVAELGISFPYLVDDTQQVARAFKAQCTPDPYLFDAEGKLVYHGRLDDNWQDESAVIRPELREAMAALAEGRSPATEQHPSMGCSIKWRKKWNR